MTGVLTLEQILTSLTIIYRRKKKKTFYLGDTPPIFCLIKARLLPPNFSEGRLDFTFSDELPNNLSNCIKIGSGAMRPEAISQRGGIPEYSRGFGAVFFRWWKWCFTAADRPALRNFPPLLSSSKDVFRLKAKPIVEWNWSYTKVTCRCKTGSLWWCDLRPKCIPGNLKMLICNYHSHMTLFYDTVVSYSWCLSSWLYSCLCRINCLCLVCFTNIMVFRLHANNTFSFLAFAWGLKRSFSVKSMHI